LLGEIAKTVHLRALARASFRIKHENSWFEFHIVGISVCREAILKVFKVQSILLLCILLSL
jgi:hypothetical protein